MRLELGPILRTVSRRKSALSLVVLELASGFMIVSCLLICGSWYLARGGSPSGLAEPDLVAVGVRVPSPSDPAAALAAAVARQRRDLETIAALPGVRGAVPMSTSIADDRWSYPVQMRADLGTTGFGWTVLTGAAAVDLLGMRILEGRSPAALPEAEQAAVTVISRCLRERLFPGGATAVGRQIWSEDAAPARVVAVVDEVIMRTRFMPVAECVAFRFGGPPPDEREGRYLVRAEPGRRREVMAGLRAALGSSGPDRVVTVLAFEPKAHRLYGVASGLAFIFVVIGINVTALAVLGAAAVSSFLVAERRRSIGIRRALGATARDVVRYFLVESTLSTVMGVGLGVLGTLAIFMLMQDVFGAIVLAWHYLALAALALWIVATLGAMIPARAAAEVPPWVASRSP